MRKESRQAVTAQTLEITPEMAAAGASALYDAGLSEALEFLTVQQVREIAAAVYVAMRRAQKGT